MTYIFFGLFLLIAIKVYWPRPETTHYNFDSYLYRSTDKTSHSKQNIVKVGDSFPQVAIYDIKGQAVKLSDLWQEKPLVIETGSKTCPIYLANGINMDEVYKKYDLDSGQANVILLYVREAHPGFFNQAHRSFDDKLTCAKGLRKKGIKRPIYVDDLSGQLHNQLGNLPNSSFVISRDGVLVHMAMWNKVNDLEQTLDLLVQNAGFSKGIHLHNDSQPSPNHLKPMELIKMILGIIPFSGPDAFLDFLSSMLKPSKKT
jgi:hypothetical protein